MRPRFSIRWLLIFTALAAAACYWWVIRPTIVANRFAKTLAARDFLAADRLCLDPNRHFVCRALHIFHWMDASPFNMGSSGAMIHPFVVEARILRQSWLDLWRGQRRLEMTIRDESRSNGVAFRVDDRLGQRIGERVETFRLTASSNSILPPAESAPLYLENQGRPLP
jgi:hypothetical protein